MSSSIVEVSSPTPRDLRIGEAMLEPDLFAEHFLQTDLWNIQRDILQSLKTEPRIAVKACHSSSKTYTAARALLWFIARYTSSLVITTAPTWVQVEKLLWGEVHAALLKSRYPFNQGEILKTELRLGPKRYAYGLSTSVTKQDEGAKFQGFHADNVLVILDEAPGVDPKIWEAIEGARAGGNVRVLAIGNPTITSGPFHDAFTKNRQFWKTFTISAFDTPNLAGIDLQTLLEMHKRNDPGLKHNPRPYLTTKSWVVEKYQEWGEGHPLWEARVMGEFPKQSEDSLLSLSWLEAAKIREQAKGGDLVAGIDVAGPGEAETSLTIRNGGHIVHHQQWPISDPRGDVVSILNQYRGALKGVNVDAVGIGHYLAKHLEDLKFPVNAIIAQAPSSDSEKFANVKAEFYWGFRKRAQDGDLSGLVDETTIGQLAGIRYKHNSRGQIEIESKEKAASRGVSSPDRAESVMLAFASKTLCFGVLDFVKEEKREAEVTKSKSILNPQAANKASCEKCGSTLIVPCQGSFRCNNCGYQFGGRTVFHRGPERTKALATEKEQNRRILLNEK